MDQENKRKSTSYHRKRYYRDLLNRIEGLQESDDVGIHAVKELGEIFKEVNLIDNQCTFADRVEHTDETLLESVVLSSASGILVKCIENLDILTSTYESTEYAGKILNEVKAQNCDEFQMKDWLTILEDVRSIIPELPKYLFLYGTFNPTHIPEPKQRKERSKREAQEKFEKKQLKRIDNIHKDEEGIDDIVNFLGKILSDEYEKNNFQPVPYFHFITDSKNFTSTVENIFHCSFLLRDGKTELNIDADGNPTLKPLRKRDLKCFRNENGVNTQMISSITMKDWEVLRRNEGCIEKHRNSLQSKIK